MGKMTEIEKLARGAMAASARRLSLEGTDGLEGAPTEGGGGFAKETRWPTELQR